VHVDPCEGAVDAPLLYEAGWGKAPALVVAAGRDGVADVTHRYSAAGAGVLAARRAAAGVGAADARALAAALDLLSGEARAACGAAPPSPARRAADAPGAGGPAARSTAPLPSRTSGAPGWVAGREEGGRPAGPAPPPPPPPPPPAPTRYERVALAAGAAAAAGARPPAPPPGLGRPVVRLQAHPAARACGLHARGSSPSPPGEGPARVFDGGRAPRAADSKWLAFDRPAWLEVRLGAGPAGAPPPPVTPIAYTLTAAGDAPGRDPAAWVVEGRRSGGSGGGGGGGGGGGQPRSSWVALDARAPGTSPFHGGRGSSVTFRVKVHLPVDALRLAVSGVAGGAGADAVQLSRWEVWVEDDTAAPLPPPPPPAPADAAKAAFAAAVRAEFDARVASGAAPNEAALAALAAVTRRRGVGE